MRSIHGLTRVTIVALGLSGLLGLRPPARAAGATPQGMYGPVLPALTSHVAPRVVPLYRGQYILTASAPAARLASGTLHIGVDAADNLIGVLALYGYDAQGYQSSEVFRLWNFGLTGPATIRSEVLTLNAPIVVGQVVVQRGARGDLWGRIRLDTRTYTFRWHKVAAQ